MQSAKKSSIKNFETEPSHRLWKTTEWKEIMTIAAKQVEYNKDLNVERKIFY